MLKHPGQPTDAQAMHAQHYTSYRDHENGAALVLALVFTVIVAGIVMTGTLVLGHSRSSNSTSFQANYQAVMTAKSGLNEGHGWLRRQTSQPVLALEPVRDVGATPPVLDTEDPDIGLTRSFQLAGNLWARYELWKTWPADPDPVRLAWRQQYECKDISDARSGAAPGSVWLLRSIGYVYVQMDASVPFNVSPNRVLASDVAEIEVKRTTIQLPGQAAINVGDGNSCYINTNGRVLGGSAAGIYYPFGSGTPTTGPVAENRVTGTPALAAGTATYDDSPEAIFGQSIAELSAIADLIVTTTAEFPSPLPENSMIIVNMASLTINSSNPLVGSGLVIVQGDLTLSPGNTSMFQGLLYVDGNLTLRAPSVINGAVVCTGNVTIQGSFDYATINYDEAALANVLEVFGSYRRSSTVKLPRRSQ